MRARQGDIVPSVVDGGRGGGGAKENGGNSQAGLFLQVIKSVLIISEHFHKYAGEMKKDEGKK